MIRYLWMRLRRFRYMSGEMILREYGGKVIVDGPAWVRRIRNRLEVVARTGSKSIPHTTTTLKQTSGTR